VCRELCELRPPVLTGVYAIEEARNFALASRQLAGQLRALGDLVNAVQSRDAKSYGEIIARFGLGPYCLQVCAWVGSVICSEFCFCVCPPTGVAPYFNAIGGYLYASVIDSTESSLLPLQGATGLTVNDTRAFYGSLRLNGAPFPTSGPQLEYCFEYVPLTKSFTTLAKPAAPTDLSITVASSLGFPTAPFNVVIGSANGGYEIMTVTNVSGTTWTVMRGQQLTAAAQAMAGATIVTGAKAAASASWTQVPTSWILSTQIGVFEIWVSTPFPHPEFLPVYAGVGPALFTPDGWITVPQGADYYPYQGNMINLDSTKLTASAVSVSEAGVSAGNPAINLPTDLYFGIRMRYRQHGSSTSTVAGTCDVVAIDNTFYTNVDQHPEWGGGLVTLQGVCMVDIKELQGTGNGCKGITDLLTVLFTASHPNLGLVSVSMKGPPTTSNPTGQYNFTVPTPLLQTGDWYGTAVPNGWTLSQLEPCAYLVTLKVPLLLTTGDSVPDPLQDQIAFCLS
jgi:hypothetical protein